MTTQTPTNGRIVHYYPRAGSTTATRDGQPLPAVICYVWNEDMINVGGFDANGLPFAATSVQLIREDEEMDAGKEYACWPPRMKV